MINIVKTEIKYVIASFAAGFGLMALEITATRIVAPYIGNSLYTWTAIISTVLFGSSIGYILGGLAIDRQPKEKTVFYFAAGAGVLVFLINIFASFLPKIALSNMSVLAISSLSAIILFLLPSILIGTISPCLLKLKAKDLSGVGFSAGVLSAFWSAGSVIGTILTGFLLVGIIGSQKIIVLVATIFLVISLMFVHNRKVFLLAFLLLLTPLSSSPRDTLSLVYSKESDYYLIRVADKEIGSLGLVRALFLDFGSHSIESLEGKKIHNYPESFPVFFKINPSIENIYLIGGGAQTLSKNILSAHENVKIDSVEIDPKVNDVSKTYFETAAESITHISGDARLDLLRRPTAKYDLIFGDAFNSVISVPGHLLTIEFNKLVKSHLNENGIYALNIASSLSGENSKLFASVKKTFSAVFPNNITLSFGGSDNRTQNIILIGSTSQNKINVNLLKESLEKETDGGWLSALISTADDSFPNASVLTDDFYPTEKLLLSNLNSYFNQYANFYYSFIK